MLGNLTPNDYLAMARYDYELADAVARAWGDGERDAREAHAANEAMRRD